MNFQTQEGVNTVTLAQIQREDTEDFNLGIMIYFMLHKSCFGC